MSKFRAGGTDSFVDLRSHSLNIDDYDVICACSTAGKSTLDQLSPGRFVDIDPVIEYFFQWRNINSDAMKKKATQPLRDRCFNAAYLLAQLLAKGDSQGPWRRTLLDFDVRPRAEWHGLSRSPRFLFVEQTPMRLYLGWRVRQLAGEPYGPASLAECKIICRKRMEAIDHYYPDSDVAMLYAAPYGSTNYLEHLCDLFEDFNLKMGDESGRQASSFPRFFSIAAELFDGLSLVYPDHVLQDK
jgi:hypothetical protein